MVREANKQGIKHAGSKPISILSRIIPCKLQDIIKNRFK